MSVEGQATRLVLERATGAGCAAAWWALRVCAPHALVLYALARLDDATKVGVHEVGDHEYVVELLHVVGLDECAQPDDVWVRVVAQRANFAQHLLRFGRIVKHLGNSLDGNRFASLGVKRTSHYGIGAAADELDVLIARACGGVGALPEGLKLGGGHFLAPTSWRRKACPRALFCASADVVCF